MVLRLLPPMALVSGRRSSRSSRSSQGPDPDRAHPSPRSPGASPSADERLVASLISLLEAGTTPWRRDWQTGASSHHCNLLTGRRYRGANPVLLSLGMPLRGSTLPFWCSFAEARAHGLRPRRGSRAVHVLQPLLQSRAATSSNQGTATLEPGAADATEASAAAPQATACWISYRPLAVFNAADLCGETLSDLIRRRQQQATLLQRPEPERLAAAEAMLSSWPVPVRFGGDRACYLPAADRIELPARNAFVSAPGLYATWAHEAIHSSGHSSRLARDLSGGMGDGGDGGRAYAREELVAELGAVLLGDRLEIGSAMENHAAYLNHWLEMLRESPRLLSQVLADARRAADLIAPETTLQAAEATDGDPRLQRIGAGAGSVEPFRRRGGLGSQREPTA